MQQNYDEIILMSQRITKGREWEEVAHYVIEQFLTHPHREELIQRDEAMKYMSGMIHLSYYSTTSPYHKIYRQGGRMVELYDTTQIPDSDYNLERDNLTEAISGILLDMETENVELWYIATLFRMWVQTGNYSEIARKTKIPRTSISGAVEECREYIKRELKNRGIEDDY